LYTSSTVQGFKLVLVRILLLTTVVAVIYLDFNDFPPRVIITRPRLVACKRRQ
jgi:hypothetical protein